MEYSDHQQDTPAAEQAQPTEARFADWPQKGGSADEPQPWDLKALRVRTHDEDGQPLLKPGEPDTISPVPIVHGRPILTSGSQGDAVRELAERLGRLGYPSSATRGENHFYVFDESLRAAVDGFRRDYNVREDPSGFTSDQRNNAESHVGPWTWEALIRASDREREAARA